jgi:hypothetical protein
MERGAAPARMPRKHPSGTPWVAVRAHYGALPSMAGRARMNAGESLRDQVASAPPRPEVRPRGAKSPQIAHAGASLCACGAPQGVCPSPRAPTRALTGGANCVHLFAHGVDCWCASRRSTSLGHFPGVDSPGPPGPRERKKEDGAPAPQTTGRMALALREPGKPGARCVGLLPERKVAV